MTIMTKKTVKKHTRTNTKRPPLPPMADVASIEGTEYLVMRLDQYYDWHEEQALTAIAAERLQRQEKDAVPFGEILESQDRKRAKRKK